MSLSADEQARQQAASALPAHTDGTSFGDAQAWNRLSSASSDAEFASAWIELQCRLIGSVQAAVVVLGPDQDGGFAPVTYWPPGTRGNAAIGSAAELAMAERRGAVRGRDGSGPGAGRLNAIAYPLLLGDELRGVVALELPHGTEERLLAAMRMLQWGCAWWHRRLAGPAAGDSSSPLPRVLELLVVALEEDLFVAAATAVVTALATDLACERVAHGVRRGRHTQVKALSHSANFNKKSGLVRALGNAMDEAIDQQEILLLPRTDDATPQVTKAHEALLNGQGSGAVCTIPLNDNDRITGALTLERDAEHPFTPDEVALCEHAAVLIGPVLEAKRREDRWIGAKVWGAVRDGFGHLFGPGHMTLKAAALGLVALSMFFVLARGEYRVVAPAVLEGTIQRALTAPIDGYIASAEVRAGDLVVAGQPIAALEDKDLRLEKLQWEAQREKQLREYNQALANDDRARVRILRAQREQAEARIALLAEQLERTRIRAPFDGIVVAGDLSQSLGTPVSRGDVLFEVAPLDSYRVILQVDERDIRQIAQGQIGRLALAGLPGERLDLTVVKITPVAVAGEGKNQFRVEARLAQPSVALRPGMQGVAKVDIEERNLFWIGTHKLVYWLRLWWWSWWG